MRQIIKDIVQQWRDAFSWRPHYYYQARELLISSIRLINNEFIALVNIIKYSFGFALGSFLILLGSIGAALFVDNTTLVTIFSDLAPMLGGLIILFFTIAIFMATISNRAQVKYSDETAKFYGVLRKEKEVFRTLYPVVKDSLDDFQKQDLQEAHAAESVFNQTTYVKYDSWVKKHTKDFKDETYRNIARDLDVEDVRRITANRAWPIKASSEAVDRAIHAHNLSIDSHLLEPLA